jgi:hypothetical protein
MSRPLVFELEVEAKVDEAYDGMSRSVEVWARTSSPRFKQRSIAFR